MGIYTIGELLEAKRSIASTLSKCEKVILKLQPGKSQYTLTVRRIAAFKIALDLIERELNKMTIRLEEPKDYREVETLTREAFWNKYRPGCMEHYVLHCYRDRPEFVKELDYVMEEDGKIIAHIMYSRAQIAADDGRIVPIIIFGPVSVLPEMQGKGYSYAECPYTVLETCNGHSACFICENFVPPLGKSRFIPGAGRSRRSAARARRMFRFPASYSCGGYRTWAGRGSRDSDR